MLFFFFSKDVLVAISRFFFGLIASTWDHQRWLESGGRDTSQRCSMFKPAKIQEARQDYRVASCTWSPWNHSEWLGMTFDSFPATSISRTSSLLLSKQESSGSFELHQLVKDRTNHVWLQHMSPQSAPAITGWILDFCHNSRCTILSVASWSSWCDFSDIFISFDLLGEVLQWRSKKPFTKSTAKLGGCEPPPMIPVTTRMTLLLLAWGPSLCHWHPYCSNDVQKPYQTSRPINKCKYTTNTKYVCRVGTDFIGDFFKEIWLGRLSHGGCFLKDKDGPILGTFHRQKLRPLRRPPPVPVVTDPPFQPAFWDCYRLGAVPKSSLVCPILLEN